MKSQTGVCMKFLVAGVLAVTPGPAAGQTIHGVPVPELSDWDTAMQSFMSGNDITAGVLAVARSDGTIIYQRGFNVPENTPMRIASLEKPITAAAIRKLDVDGLLDPNDRVFDVGQAGGGLLGITPYNGLGDARYADITVGQLVQHRGGFDTNIVEPQFNSINICADLRTVDPGVTDPAGTHNTVRWMLSRSLQYDPGDPNTAYCGQVGVRCYSNFGYMVLGMILTELTGQSNLVYLRNNILTPQRWIPSTEIKFGRSFAHNQSPREPFYDDGTTDLAWNVFDPGGAPVEAPYGGWEQEVFAGHGNLVMSAAPLLIFMEHYRVWSGGPSGMPLNGAGGGGVHTGGLTGTSTVMFQRCDGINIVVLFNKAGRVFVPGSENVSWCPGSVPNGGSSNIDYALAMAQQVSAWTTDLLNSGGSLPDFAVDGFWVEFGATGSSEVGGFNEPFTSMSSALLRTTDGTRLRFLPGTTGWTGTIDERMRLDAPFGMARIGQ